VQRSRGHTPVCSQLTINDANLATITGGDTDAADTVLQRGNGSLTSIMYLQNAAKGLVIEYLTFDGNRWAFGAPPTCTPKSGGGVTCASQYSTPPNVSCVGPSSEYYDLNAGTATIVTVQYVNFINGPITNLVLGGSTHNPGASTVSYSNFGSLSNSKEGNRGTAMFVMGQYSGAY
jgi:hypothetical protein